MPIAPLRARGDAYVEMFRGVPLLVQMFLWFFVVPEIVPRDWGRWLKRDLPDPEFWTAVVALGFYTACRVAEQVRAGHPVDIARPSQRGAGERPHLAADLSLRPAAAVATAC